MIVKRHTTWVTYLLQIALLIYFIGGLGFVIYIGEYVNNYAFSFLLGILFGYTITKAIDLAMFIDKYYWKKSPYSKVKPKLTFVTGNKNKLQEVQSILSTIQVVNLDIDLPEIQGEPMDVIKNKVKYVKDNELVDGPFIIEDTSLLFNALNGLPGPYIKSFYDKIGNDGLVKLLSGHQDKSASAQCIFAFCSDFDSKPEFFTGICRGIIVDSVNSNLTSFGWDTIFKPNNYDFTFATIEPQIKNKISHRAKALDTLSEYLNKLDYL